SINISCVAVVLALTTITTSFNMMCTVEASSRHHRRNLSLRVRDNFVPGCGPCHYLEPRPGLTVAQGNPKARFPKCCPSLKPASPTA
ncbi:hypothetical protein BDF22DRAFT_699925, partial [Syncephalis plumigaleata]